MHTANQPETEKSAAIVDAQELLAIVRKGLVLYKLNCKGLQGECMSSLRKGG